MSLPRSERSEETKEQGERMSGDWQYDVRVCGPSGEQRDVIRRCGVPGMKRVSSK